MIGPVIKLRSITDSVTGVRVDAGKERAECLLDGEGHTVRWRIWARGADGAWRPVSAWRTTSWHAACVPARSRGGTP
jgi:hypothetical protein